MSSSQTPASPRRRSPECLCRFHKQRAAKPATRLRLQVESNFQRTGQPKPDRSSTRTRCPVAPIRQDQVFRQSSTSQSQLHLLFQHFLKRHSRTALGRLGQCPQEQTILPPASSTLPIEGTATEDADSGNELDGLVDDTEGDQ